MVGEISPMWWDCSWAQGPWNSSQFWNITAESCQTPHTPSLPTPAWISSYSFTSLITWHHQYISRLFCFRHRANLHSQPVPTESFSAEVSCAIAFCKSTFNCPEFMFFCIFLTWISFHCYLKAFS